MKINSSFALCASLLLSACVDQGSFPSLAKRPFETNSAAVAAPAPALPQLVSDPALLVRAGAAVARARAGVSGFEAVLPAARSSVGQGAARGSDSWINAQLQLSRLERTLEPANAALSDLDSERRAVQLNPLSADGPALAEAIATVSEIAERQSSQMKSLLGRLNR
jgi:hypothetical protein